MALNWEPISGLGANVNVNNQNDPSNKFVCDLNYPYFKIKCNNKNLCTTSPSVPNNATELSKQLFCQKIKFNPSYTDYINSMKCFKQYSADHQNYCTGNIDCYSNLYITNRSFQKMLNTRTLDQINNTTRKKQFRFKSYQDYLIWKRAQTELLPNQAQVIFS